MQCWEDGPLLASPPPRALGTSQGLGDTIVAEAGPTLPATPSRGRRRPSDDALDRTPKARPAPAASVDPGFAAPPPWQASPALTTPFPSPTASHITTSLDEATYAELTRLGRHSPELPPWPSEPEAWPERYAPTCADVKEGEELWRSALLAEEQEDEIDRFLDCLTMQASSSSGGPAASAQQSQVPYSVPGSQQSWRDMSPGCRHFNIATPTAASRQSTAQQFEGPSVPGRASASSTSDGRGGSLGYDSVQSSNAALWDRAEATLEAAMDVRLRAFLGTAPASSAVHGTAGAPTRPHNVFLEESFGGEQGMQAGAAHSELLVEKFQVLECTPSMANVSTIVAGGSNDYAFSQDHELQMPRAAPEGATTAHDDMEANSFLPNEIVLVPCRICGRRFRADRLPRHEDVCHKAEVDRRHRSVFESKSQRCSELEGRWWLLEDPLKPSVPAQTSAGPGTSNSPATQHHRTVTRVDTGLGQARPQAKSRPTAAVRTSSAPSLRTRSSTASVPEVASRYAGSAAASVTASPVPSRGSKAFSRVAASSPVGGRGTSHTAAGRACSTPTKAGRKAEQQTLPRARSPPLSGHRRSPPASGTKAAGNGASGKSAGKGRSVQKIAAANFEKGATSRGSRESIETPEPSSEVQEIFEDSTQQLLNDMDVNTPPPRKFELTALDRWRGFDAACSAEKTTQLEQKDDKPVSPRCLKVDESSDIYAQLSDAKALPDLQKLGPAAAFLSDDCQSFAADHEECPITNSRDCRITSSFGSVKKSHGVPSNTAAPLRQGIDEEREYRLDWTRHVALHAQSGLEKRSEGEDWLHEMRDLGAQAWREYEPESGFRDKAQRGEVRGDQYGDQCGGQPTEYQCGYQRGAEWWAQYQRDSEGWAQYQLNSSAAAIGFNASSETHGKQVSSLDSLLSETAVLPQAPPLPSLESGAVGPPDADYSGLAWQLPQRTESDLKAMGAELAAGLEMPSGHASFKGSLADDNPVRFSDPEVLSAMMADVKLLGAHVDQLIGVQQKLLSKAGSSSGGEPAGESRTQPSTLPPATTRAVVYAATTAPTAPTAAWNGARPSRAYDPARYGNDADSAAEAFDLLSHVVDGNCSGVEPALQSPPRERSWGSPVDAELLSSVDSLERRSLLFQRRIRECSQHVAERRGNARPP